MDFPIYVSNPKKPKICAIIAEYNPFHNGHAYQIQTIRKLLGEDTAIVCFMSGNYVQRGDLAVLEKYQRSKVAVQCGVDLVLELPLDTSLSSAERFGSGAVQAIESCDAIDYLAFGVETETTTKDVVKLAKLLEEPKVQNQVKKALLGGVSYAKAIESALSHEISFSLMQKPNLILAMAYVRALLQKKSHIYPIAIPRKDVEHHSLDPVHAFASATWIRQKIFQNQLQDCKPYLPSCSFHILQKCIEEDHMLPSVQTIEHAMKMHYMRLSKGDLLPYITSKDGFLERIWNAIQQENTFDAICQHAKTKRYHLSYIRRTLLRIWLGLKHQPANIPPDYLRILAIGNNGREILRHFSKTSSTTLITKPAQEKNLPDFMQSSLQQDTLADELYHLATSKELYIPGVHFIQTPYCIK